MSLLIFIFFWVLSFTNNYAHTLPDSEQETNDDQRNNLELFRHHSIESRLFTYIIITMTDNVLLKRYNNNSLRSQCA